MIDAILVPRGSEARAVRSALRKGRASIAIVEMGVGPRAAAQAAEALLARPVKPRRVLVTGLAGLLSPAFSVGDVLVYATLSRDDGARSLALDRDLAQQVMTSVPGALGGVSAVQSDAIVTRALAKRDLGARTRAAAVDMESFSAAESLQAAGIEVAVLRVGSDAYDEDLPELDRALDGSGGIDGFALFLAMVREPVSGARMAGNGMAALGSLRRAIAALTRNIAVAA